MRERPVGEAGLNPSSPERKEVDSLTVEWKGTEYSFSKGIKSDTGGFFGNWFDLHIGYSKTPDALPSSQDFFLIRTLVAMELRKYPEFGTAEQVHRILSDPNYTPRDPQAAKMLSYFKDLFAKDDPEVTSSLLWIPDSDGKYPTESVTPTGKLMRYKVDMEIPPASAKTPLSIANPEIEMKEAVPGGVLYVVRGEAKKLDGMPSIDMFKDSNGKKYVPLEDDIPALGIFGEKTIKHGVALSIYGAGLGVVCRNKHYFNMWTPLYGADVVSPFYRPNRYRLFQVRKKITAPLVESSSPSADPRSSNIEPLKLKSVEMSSLKR